MLQLKTSMGRPVLICCATLVYALLIVDDGKKTFLYGLTHPALALWVQFSTSTLISLIFLAVGALVWLYARERIAAGLLFCFSCSMMVVFVVQTGALYNDRFLILLSSVGAAAAIPLLVMLLFFFPRNYFHYLEEAKAQRQEQAWLYTLLLQCARIYTRFLLLFATGSICSILLFFFLPLHRPLWLVDVIDIYQILGLASAIFITIAIYVQTSSLRERQQLRLFVAGVVLTLTPFLLLTIIPMVLHFSKSYMVNAQFSALSFIVFPLSLGYSVLRYQILVFDTYIRRACLWLMGCIGLMLLVYLVITVSSQMLLATPTVYVVIVTSVTALLAPLVWGLAKIITERLFFSEALHYRRLMDVPSRLADTTLELHEAVRLCTVAFMQAFETTAVCFFILEEESGYYRLCPEIRHEPNDAERSRLAASLARAFGDTRTHEKRDWFALHHPFVIQMMAAQRPFLLSEVVARGKQVKARVGLHRYITMAHVSSEEDALVAPIRVQGKMIGVVVLGERGDQQAYAGPDFEAIELLLSRFASLLETARLYRKARQHADLLNKLYATDVMPNDVFQMVNNVACSYASIVAEAVTAVAEIWLYDEQRAYLCRVALFGAGTPLVEAERLLLDATSDWSSCFYEGEDSWQNPLTTLPTCVERKPALPFAWLPMHKGSKRLGVLILAYQRPRVFTSEERRVLEMFANQCAAALENARITLDLQLAYKRQKELDALKDQFIVITSHELRTPLTAVQGYIELLEQYGETLDGEERLLFTRQAHRGCDELVLMVENIMDASRVRVEAQNINLQEIALAEPVEHVLEILGALLKSEQHTVRVNIATDLSVLADHLRLRQVLLNLLSNARKYSPTSTPLEITARREEQFVVIAIRDYGSGISIEDQSRLFERFVRLERDMNSPVRGAGLGLYICKQLVEAMGGRIWVESSGCAGEGSTFSFTLPYAARLMDATRDTTPHPKLLSA